MSISDEENNNESESDVVCYDEGKTDESESLICYEEDSQALYQCRESLYQSLQ